MHSVVQAANAAHVLEEKAVTQHNQDRTLVDGIDLTLFQELVTTS